MKRFKIGYAPLSKDLLAPGDRRRLVYWAKKRGHEIVTNLDQGYDILVLSEKANLSEYLSSKKRTPWVFDLVDGYLERENFQKDWLRGIARNLDNHEFSLPLSFTKQVIEICGQADAVICSSVEQQSDLSFYARNTHVILDFHEEIPLGKFSKNRTGKPKLFWEGLPATIDGLKPMSEVFSGVFRSEWELNIVTNLTYFRLLDKYFERETRSKLNGYFKENFKNISLNSWDLKNLVRASASSTIGILPVNISNPIQRMKPENRLLIMWRLGLPVVASPLQSYSRISKLTKIDLVADSIDEWGTKLLDLFKNPDLAEDHVSKGQLYLDEFHSEEILLRKWDRVFENLL